MNSDLRHHCSLMLADSAAHASSTAAAWIETPPPDLAGWVAELRDRDIPVLESSACALEQWRALEDHADPRSLAAWIDDDPLMTLKTLIQGGRSRSARANGDAETVTAALVMMGIGPFFRSFTSQYSVEAHLAQRPAALLGLQAVIHRARRAAQFALGFAVHRHDPDAAVIHESALLHDFAEMLLWCHAPALALELQTRQKEQPQLRSKDAQRTTLNVELTDLRHALMLEWRLPELIVEVSGDHRARLSRVRCVLLAVRLARHSANGWSNPALPDDLRDIGELLNLAPDPAVALIHDLDS